MQTTGYQYSVIRPNSVLACFRYCLICSLWLSIIFGIGKSVYFLLKSFYILANAFFYIYRQPPANGLANRDDDLDGMFAEIAARSVDSKKKLLYNNVIEM